MHPSVRPTLEGGTRIAYGARALNEGGLQVRSSTAYLLLNNNNNDDNNNNSNSNNALIIIN